MPKPHLGKSIGQLRRHFESLVGEIEKLFAYQHVHRMKSINFMYVVKAVNMKLLPWIVHFFMNGL